MKKTIATLAAIALISSAFAQEEKQIPLINVNGEYTVKVEPDGATVNFMVSTTNLDLKTAKSENDAIVSNAISYLKAQQILDEDMKTTRVDLQPYNEYVKDAEPIQKFRAQQAITFKVKALSNLTELLSGLVDQGVNTIQSVTFTSTQLGALQDKARKEAILDAQRKAVILAEALGQKAGKAHLINDNTYSGGTDPIVYRAFAESADRASAKSAPIAAGEIEVKANVQVGFLLF